MQNNYILEQRKHGSSPDQVIRSWAKADGTRKTKKSLLSAMEFKTTKVSTSPSVRTKQNPLSDLRSSRGSGESTEL
jgi:hypothetical protein